MLLWIDSFDKYGGSATLLTQGIYAAAAGVTLSSAAPRTGTYCARITPLTGDRGLRRVFGADLQEAGVGYAFNIPTLPSASEQMIVAGFADNALNYQLVLSVSTTGQIVAHRGNPNDVGSIVLGTSAPVVTAGSYQHFECRAYCDSIDGAVEVRMNGVTVLNLVGVDTDAEDSGNFAQVKIGLIANNFSGFPAYMDVDDLFAWDTASGTQNVDFIGDKKVYCRLPDGDTAQADWVPSAGTEGWSILDNQPPNDAIYISAPNPGAVSRFDIANLPAEVVSIAGVQITLRAFKSDAGNAKVQTGIRQGSDTDVGVLHALTQAPAGYSDVFETDPTTGAPFTVSDFDSLLLQIDRVE